MDKKLTRNRWKCKQCGTELESKHRHDFVECACGNYVDGGLDYVRIGGPAVNENPMGLEDLREYSGGEWPRCLDG